MYDGIRSFKMNEEKYVEFEVRSKSLHTIVIASATYELKRADEIINTGNCEINNSRMTILLKPPSLGEYMLEVTYRVAPETRKIRVIIRVV